MNCCNHTKKSKVKEKMEKYLIYREDLRESSVYLKK